VVWGHLRQGASLLAAPDRGSRSPLGGAEVVSQLAQYLLSVGSRMRITLVASGRVGSFPAKSRCVVLCEWQPMMRMEQREKTLNAQARLKDELKEMSM
jgi:hypothetical protein